MTDSGYTHSKLRVAILSPSLVSTSGGVERFCFALRDAFDPVHDVRVFAPRHRGSRLTNLVGLGSLSAAMSAREEIRGWQPDVLVTNGGLGVLGSVGGAARVHVYHGTMVLHSFRSRHGKKVRDWLMRGIIGGGFSEMLSGLPTAYRVAVSRSAAREVRAFYHFKLSRVIPNFGTASTAPAPAARAGVIFVGRRESRKGYEEAVRISSGVGKRLRVAGTGTDPRTEDLGILSQSELGELYVASEAMLFPTRYEACSFVILDALANGCPVVTSRVGWMDELVAAVPSYDGLTFAWTDQAAAAVALREVLAGRHNDAVESAREWVLQSASWTAFAESWQSVIRSVAIARRRRKPE